MSLSSLVSPGKRPLFFTICADGGMGKTSLAALFPGVVIIRTEDGSRSIEDRKDVALFPVAKSVEAVFGNIQDLIAEKHDFKTLVIDSITQFDQLATAKILADDPKARSLNQAMGGYGAGRAAVANIHRELREACGYLAENKDMHIVFIAHAVTESVDLPDQDSFSRYTIRMHPTAMSHYTDNVDVVAFIKLKMFTSGEGDTKRATTSGQRIITCYPHPAHVSKNRLGIKADINFNEGENPFAQYL